MKKTYFRFGTKLIFVSCMSMVIIAIFISQLSYRKYQKSMEDKTSSSVMQAFIQANELMDYNIRSYENLLSLIADNQTIQNVLSITYNNQYDWYIGHRELLKESSEIAVSHFDNPDIQYYFLREHPITILPQYTMPHPLFPKDFVERNLETYGYACVWSDVRVEEKEYFLLVSKLCMNEVQGTNNAIAYITINCDKLFKSLSKLDYEGSKIFVLSEENEILYTEQEKYIGSKYSNSLVLHNIKKKENGNFVATIDGTKCMVVYNNQNKNNWTLIGILPYEMVMNEIKHVRSSVWFGTALVTLLGFLWVYFYLKSNTKKITILSKAMEDAGNGLLDVQVNIKDHGEISQMAQVFTSMLFKIKNQIQQLEEARKREHTLELRTLQEQINPHLLYNTLATIRSQAEEIEAYDICHTTQALVSYYKLTLSEGVDLITVKDEIEHAKAYLEIMNTRFGNHLTINMEIEPQVTTFLCPKIILQPFFENSIYHGFKEREHYEGSIFLRVSAQEETIVFEIEDDGCGISEDRINRIMTEQGSSYAVKNVDTRIKLYFGDAYGIRLSSQLNKGCKVTIVIPQRKEYRKP